MSNVSPSTAAGRIGHQLQIATLRASIALGQAAVIMGRHQQWVIPADRAALHEVEYRQLPAMRNKLRLLEAAT